MVTRIAALPNYSQLEAIIATGKKRHLWEDKLVSTVSKFAKINSCKKLSFGAGQVRQEYQKNGVGKLNTYKWRDL